jgi:hypothetical protein
VITAYDSITFGDCTHQLYLRPDFYTAENTAALIREYNDFTLFLYHSYSGTRKNSSLPTGSRITRFIAATLMGTPSMRRYERLAMRVIEPYTVTPLRMRPWPVCASGSRHGS